MALYETLKEVNLEKEQKSLKPKDTIELTVKRAEEIERAVEEVKPGYGPVFKRKPDEK